MNKENFEFLNEYMLLEQLCHQALVLSGKEPADGKDKFMNRVMIFAEQCPAEENSKLRQIINIRNMLAHSVEPFETTAEMTDVMKEMLGYVVDNALASLKKIMSEEQFAEKYPDIDVAEQYTLAKNNVKNRLERVIRVGELEAPEIIIGNEQRMLLEAITNPLNGKFIDKGV